VNADRTGLTRLTSNSVKDYAPAWSPDGSMIAFASNRNDPNPSTCAGIFGGCNIDIFVMPASGGSPVQVTFGSGTQEFPELDRSGTRAGTSRNGASRTRTGDLLGAIQALSQLSYSPARDRIVAESEHSLDPCR
jgi:Tol biopolymer transport system component